MKQARKHPTFVDKACQQAQKQDAKQQIDYSYLHQEQTFKQK
jgi:hypothetical protein